MQYWIGCISWGLGGSVVTGDGETAFEICHFVHAILLQNVTGVGKPWFHAYLCIVYAMLICSTG